MSSAPPRLQHLYPDLAGRLAALARDARPTDLLTLVVPLPGELGWPTGWGQEPSAMAWARPAEDSAWLGLGAAFTVESAGPGRFAALHAQHAHCMDHGIRVAGERLVYLHPVAERDHGRFAGIRRQQLREAA